MKNEDITIDSFGTEKKPLKDVIRLIFVCALSAVISIGLSGLGIGKENALMVFLVGVLTVTAVTRGYIYGAIASVFSVIL